MMIRLPENEDPAVRRDVLSAEEEGVLFALRGAVTELRGRLPVSGPLQADDVARISGANPCGGPDISGARTYGVGNIRFSLQMIPGPGERVEICFVADNR